MNEEKGLLTTTDFGRIFKNYLPFTVSKLQKNESLPHSFFLVRKSSKVIFRVTQKSLRILLNYFRKYLALRGSDRASDKFVYHQIYLSLQNSLPMLANLEVTLQSFCSALGWSISVGLSYAWRHREFHNLKCKCYGRK